jgi:hypothetical protein
MSIEQEQRWITGEEYGRERRRLIQEGVPDDALEFQELRARVRARDEHLYERYGKRYLESHYGKWIAISPEGQVIIRDTASETGVAAVEAFGSGNFAIRKLAELSGHELRH